MSTLTDFFTEIVDRIVKQDRIEDTVNKVKKRLNDMENPDADDLPHILHVRTREPDAPAQSQDSYTGLQMQRVDGSVGAETVYDERDDHWELYTDRDGNGYRVKRLSIESGMEDTVLNFDTVKSHKERRRVKDGGIFQSWLLDNANYDGHSVLTEEYDSDTGVYSLVAPKTGAVLLEEQVVPDEDLEGQ